MITSVEEMLAQYIAAWNESTLEGYRKEFAKCWDPQGTYTDLAVSNLTGVEALSDFANKSLQIIPERKFSIHETPEYHHQKVKFVWSVTFNNQKNIGWDYIEYSDDFKIIKLVSFFKLPEDYPIDKIQ